MESGIPQSFTSFDSLFRFFSDADEIVFQLYFKVSDVQIATLCREARHLAHHLQAHFGSRRTAEIAAAYGVEVAQTRWQAAAGQVIYLGECTLQPPKINLNLDAIEALREFGQRMAGKDEKRWFSERQIGEVATAHELYHIIRQRSSSQPVELAAHAFARAFTELPFSGLLYNVLLWQLKRGI